MAFKEVLAEAFVHQFPDVPQTTRGGQVEPLWSQWFRAFYTWLTQAQTVTDVTDRLVANRVGQTVCMTGTIGAGERIDGIGPARSFSVGSVFFSEEGFIRNDGEETSLSVTFVTRR